MQRLAGAQHGLEGRHLGHFVGHFGVRTHDRRPAVGQAERGAVSREQAASGEVPQDGERHPGVEPEPVWLDADATRLEQVMSNLLSNAVKFTPAGGRIVVRAGRGGDQAVVRVTDSGVGIEPALLPKVFDLFVQADRSLDRSEGGLGVGLTIARRLVQLHGGSISAFSEGAGMPSSAA